MDDINSLRSWLKLMDEMDLSGMIRRRRVGWMLVDETKNADESDGRLRMKQTLVDEENPNG